MSRLFQKPKPTPNRSLAPEEEIDLIRQEVERLESELNEQNNNFPYVPDDLSIEKKGEYLLNAFLKDEPFDRYTFAFEPIKISFLNAAFRTCDPEIITYALNQVRNTLDPVAFNQLLDTSPQFRGAFEYLSHPTKKSKLIVLNSNASEKKLIEDLKKERANSNDLMKLVINDQIARISGKPIAGMEEVDLKWKNIFDSVNEPQLIKTDDMTSKSFFRFFNKWAVVVDPKQAALVMRSLGYPDDQVMQFARLVSDQKEKAELESYGIRP